LRFRIAELFVALSVEHKTEDSPWLKHKFTKDLQMFIGMSTHWFGTNVPIPHVHILVQLLRIIQDILSVFKLLSSLTF
jgi:hypothetical protein